QDRDGVAEAPEHADQDGAAERPLAADDRGHGDHVVGIGRVSHAEEEPEAHDRQQGAHDCPSPTRPPPAEADGTLRRLAAAVKRGTGKDSARAPGRTAPARWSTLA